MKQIKTMTDAVNKNQNSIILFTRGFNTELSHINDSHTGDWKIDKTKEIDEVIIYHRNDETNKNTIYSGEYINRTVSNNDSDKVVLHMSNVKRLGHTDKNWAAFTERNSASNPIAYIMNK